MWLTIGLTVGFVFVIFARFVEIFKRNQTFRRFNMLVCKERIHITMAIKKENAKVSAGGEKLKDKKGEDLIRARRDLKEKKEQKNYEAGIDPQVDQLNTVPEGEGHERGRAKPGGGNRMHTDKLKQDK